MSDDIKLKLAILVMPIAEENLSKLENRKDFIELLNEIENSPIMFFAHSKIESEITAQIQKIKEGKVYRFPFKNRNLIFYKPEQDNKLYLISIL